MSTPAGSPELPTVAARLHRALNAHDIDAFIACFHDDYDSRQPAHPDRAFRGSAQARSNWTAIFEGVPDFTAELVSSAVSGDTEYSEWHWRGTHSDGTLLDMVGVIICGVRDGLMSWARLYVEPVEEAGAGIQAAVKRIAGDD
jgi:ketosteroid isomerase-like protein